MKKQYDYLLVGSGLFAGVFAYYAKKAGKTCLVLEKREHAGGNIYCENIEGINVHRYGAHIFHTSNKEVWNFVNSLVEFNRYTNSPVANYKGEMYNMPFNMNTFSRMWGISTPEEAKKIINEQRKVIKGEPKNLEEQAISLVGTHIYQKLVKGYTEKQWGRDCKELPAFIIKRLPVRYTYDNNYFNDLYQGIPIGGYNKITEKLFEGCEIRLGADYLADKEKYDALADKVVYTGTIDSYFDYCFGKLQYRSLRFETEVLDCDNYQGNAVIQRNFPFVQQEADGKRRHGFRHRVHPVRLPLLKRRIVRRRLHFAPHVKDEAVHTHTFALQAAHKILHTGCQALVKHGVHSLRRHRPPECTRPSP